MRDKRFLPMRRRLAPALVSLIVCVLNARGEDLLDAVLNAPAPAQTNMVDAVLNTPTLEGTEKADAVSADTADDSIPAELDMSAEADVTPPVSLSLPDGVDIVSGDIGQGFKDSSREAYGRRSSSRLMLSGGAGGEGASFANLEMEIPFWKYFDIQLRGFYVSGEFEHEKRGQYTTYRYWYSYWSGMHRYPVTHYYTYTETEDVSVAGVSAVIDLNPWRGRLFAPYLGFGIRPEGGSVGEYDYSESPVVVRIGAQLNLGRRLTLNGEIIGGTYRREILGDIGFYLTRHTEVHFVINSTTLFLLDMIDGEEELDDQAFTMLGAGISYDF